MKKIILVMLIVMLVFNISAYAEEALFSIADTQVYYLSGAITVESTQPLFAPSVNKNTVSLLDNEGSELALINVSYENSEVLIVPQFPLESAEKYSVVFSSDIVSSDMLPIDEQTVEFTTTMKDFAVKNVEFAALEDLVQITVKMQNLESNDKQAVLAVTMIGSSGMIEKCSLFPITVTASDSNWEQVFSVTPKETICEIYAVVINDETADNSDGISSAYKWIKD